MRNLTLALLMMIGFSCTQQTKTKELKLAHGLDVSHPVHTGMVYMAKRLEEISGGQMTMKIYPSGQLGNERELLELLQIGSLSLTKVSAAIVENFAPKFKVLGLPYLFESTEHMYEVLDGPIGEGLLEEGEKYRFRGLCYYDAGSRSFYTKERPVEAPADLDGMKIRVMKSNTAMNMVTALGGSPTPISFGELYTALQQGVVDGAENNPPSFYSSRHYEVCKYYSLDEHTSVPDVLLVSLEWWQNMTPQEQGWLKQAALESVPFQRAEWAKSEKESLEKVAAAGVEIIRPDKSKFTEQVSSIYEDYKDQTELYELILKIKEEAK
tara:strand:+ start:478 stop:1449 length:972 start_codon:yes stop_codon:yes gene_type:complete